MGMSTKEVIILLLTVGGLVIGGMYVTGNFSAADNPDQTQKDDDAVGDLDVKVKDAQADSLTYAAANYKVYNSDGVEVKSGSTSASGFTTVSDLNEFESYTFRVYNDDGSGDDYYQASTEVEVPETSKPVILEADKQGSLTTSVLEDSGTEDDGTISLNQGQTETVTLEMEESTADAVFNRPAVFVKASANESAIDNIEVKGASEISETPDRLSTDTGYDTGVDQLVDFGSATVDIEITRADGNSDSAEVTIVTADGDQFEDDQGDWVFGYEDSADADLRLGDNTDTVTVN
jgi:hypothetical protein